MVMVRALRGGRITIVLYGNRNHVCDVAFVMFLHHRMALVMIVICQIGSERARKGVGNVGLTVGVQGTVYNGDRGLNHEHGDQHHGQSRHAFPKPVVQMLQQGSLARVALAAFSPQAAFGSMRHRYLRIELQACQGKHRDDQEA